MTDTPPARLPSETYARAVDSVKMVDPGLSMKGFTPQTLGDIVRFADLMASAGPMLPEHLKNKPAVCLAITSRALHWQFDPFALAQESYQPSPNAPVGYQSKVFSAALKNCAGIVLDYRYEGTLERTGEPVRSAKGNVIAPNGFRGDRRCIAFEIGAEGRREYTTPAYDDILTKNSPLWHSDPDQQLAYFAARAWVRRYEPGVIMGAYSTDEVDEMAREARDVTPKQSGFARRVTAGVSVTPDTGEAPPEPTPLDGEVWHPETTEGAEAARSGAARGDCPYTEDAEKAARWFAGFDMVAEGEADE